MTGVRLCPVCDEERARGGMCPTCGAEVRRQRKAIAHLMAGLLISGSGDELKVHATLSALVGVPDPIVRARDWHARRNGRTCDYCGGKIDADKPLTTRFCTPTHKARASEVKGILRLARLNPTQAYWQVSEGPLSRRSDPTIIALRGFLANVDLTTATPATCWAWLLSKNGGGYGQARRGGEKIDAHRLAYELFVGAIPEGFVVDHVRDRGCTRRDCVNPAHLEAITERENLLRGNSPAAINARKTHCDHGHPLTGDNVYWYEREPGRWRRDCKTCKREALVRFWGTGDEARARKAAYARKWRKRKRIEREALAA